jgi:hypothetical protein
LSFGKDRSSGRAAIIFAAALAAAQALPAALPDGWPGGTPAALAGSDCSGSREAGERKMERDKEREAQRRRENFPADPEEIFRKCLGGIMRQPPGPGLPPLPDLDDVLEEFCRRAREGIGSMTLSPSGSFGIAPDIGGNTALPWTGDLNEDIWNALRRGY